MLYVQCFTPVATKQQLSLLATTNGLQHKCLHSKRLYKIAIQSQSFSTILPIMSLQWQKNRKGQRHIGSMISSSVKKTTKNVCEKLQLMFSEITLACTNKRWRQMNKLQLCQPLQCTSCLLSRHEHTILSQMHAPLKQLPKFQQLNDSGECSMHCSHQSTFFGQCVQFTVVCLLKMQTVLLTTLYMCLRLFISGSILSFASMMFSMFVFGLNSNTSHFLKSVLLARTMLL